MAHERDGPDADANADVVVNDAANAAARAALSWKWRRCGRILADELSARARDAAPRLAHVGHAAAGDRTE